MCYTWIGTTSVMPNYIHTTEKDKYYIIHKAVLERMTKLKVDSILVIFNNMTKEEKKECIIKLSKNI